MCRTMLLTALAFVTLGVIAAQEPKRPNPDRPRGDQPVERRRDNDAPQPPDEPRRRRNSDEAPQPPQPPREGQFGRGGMGGVMMGPTQITATGKFVYLLRGNEILQFNAESLEFIKKVTVPPPERPDRREDGERRDRPDRPPQPPRPDEN